MGKEVFLDVVSFWLLENSHWIPVQHRPSNQETPLNRKKSTMHNHQEAEKQGTIGSWVLYKNNQLIAFNKPPGLPVQADKTGDKALLQLAEIFCKSRLYPIHRLDRPASGVVLFAKTKSAAGSLGEQFGQREVNKTYLALVKGTPPEPAGTLRHFIKKNAKNNRAAISDTEIPDGQPAELTYRLLGSVDNYNLLEVGLVTGRHHQIRAQLAAAGCPIKGDVKYGARRSNPDRSIDLHAWKLSFRHPVSGEMVTLEADLPPGPIWEACAGFLCS